MLLCVSGFLIRREGRGQGNASIIVADFVGNSRSLCMMLEEM